MFIAYLHITILLLNYMLKKTHFKLHYIEISFIHSLYLGLGYLHIIIHTQVNGMVRQCVKADMHGRRVLAIRCCFVTFKKVFKVHSTNPACSVVQKAERTEYKKEKFLNKIQVCKVQTIVKIETLEIAVFSNS